MVVGTLFRTFVGLQVIVVIISYLLAATFVLASGVSFAVEGLVIAGLLTILTVVLITAWVARGIRDFGGVPFPGLLGLLGVEIVDEDTLEWEEREAVRVYGWNSPDLPPPTLGPATPPPGIDRPSPPDTVSRGCPRCGVVTDGLDSRFCRHCGAPLEPVRLPPRVPASE